MFLLHILTFSSAYVIILVERRVIAFIKGTSQHQMGSQVGINPPGYDHLVFEVDDIVAVQAWLESQGVTAGSLEDVTIPGIGDFKYLRFKDPEGNLLGLRQPVKKPGD